MKISSDSSCLSAFPVVTVFFFGLLVPVLGSLTRAVHAESFCHQIPSRTLRGRYPSAHAVPTQNVWRVCTQPGSMDGRRGWMVHHCTGGWMEHSAIGKKRSGRPRLARSGKATARTALEVCGRQNVVATPIISPSSYQW